MPNRIQQLSDLVINQIAAGEVIERPASVVKELIENALDAGATDIRISIEAGGKDLIRIVDNGSGMNPEDLELCHLRHTTSKLRTSDDLIRIATNGFRGEAVASIASVSRLHIISRTIEDSVAHQLSLEGGTIQERTTLALPVGTQFQVRDLFFNTPVRRNFLGSDTLETAKISDTVTRIALAHSDKRFELKQGQRELFLGVPGTLQARIAEVIGSGVSKHMTSFDTQEGSIRVHGFVAPPEETRGRRNLQFFFLGQRPIFNSVIAKAVQRAYEPYGKVGYPVVVLFLEMAGGEFDVNVHPAKREVRFSNENEVFLAVHHAVRDALMQQGEGQVISLGNWNSLPASAEQVKTEIPTTSPNPIAQISTRQVLVNEEPRNKPLAPPPLLHVQAPPQPYRSAPNPTPLPREAQAQDLFSLPEYGKIVPLSPKLFQKPIEAKPTSLDNMSGRFLQWSRTYIVCEDSQGLLIIDQNAASQRILYDRALVALEASQGMESQELLFPDVLEMTRAEGIILQEHVAHLSTLGFHLEPFGGGSWQLRGIPVHLPVGRAEWAIRDFLRQLQESIQESDAVHDALAKAFAQGSALQAGTALNSDEMSGLLEQLVLTRDPYQSPFGRPALLRLPLQDIHRRFKRADGL